MSIKANRAGLRKAERQMGWILPKAIIEDKKRQATELLKGGTITKKKQV